MIMKRQEIRELSAHFLPRCEVAEIRDHLSGQIRGLLKVLKLTIEAGEIERVQVIDAIDRIIERETSPLKTHEASGVTTPRQYTAEEVGFLKALKDARVAFGEPGGD